MVDICKIGIIQNSQRRINVGRILMLRDKIGDDQMTKFIVSHTLSCFEFHKKGITLLYKQQIKTEYTSASELLYIVNQLQLGNST